ncbi:nuclear transport factor 2 family protein [Massilia sp. IC2-477]|uniref:nuclear transport factor 2 family protein n=1 Tax=Massilia sp. IC2-477 TaxID=2887198 RepID=UPI001D1297AC|nr:nuclear transport factor 2 family protein [Massilia sp. IC2-477]
MKKLLLSVALAITMSPLWAQHPSKLYQEIAAADKRLFDAFNRQDANGVSAAFSTDLEFFHDTGGLSNFEQNQEATRKLFARNMHLRSELVPGSMEVFEVKDYGAIQKGKHSFCHMENGKNDCGTLSFLHIWKRTGNGWKLARVVSYGH